MTQNQQFSAVYGPVQSWRFGQSLGIDPIGARSTCSFNCVYCQLGEIEDRTAVRRVFVSTAQILQEIQDLAPKVTPDVVTLSGSGEPTLALNLSEILIGLKAVVNWPVVVLTNGTLLGEAAVRSALRWADQVVIKLDAVTPDQLQRVNRPTPAVDWLEVLAGIRLFVPDYPGRWAVQTMLLQPWSHETRSHYLGLLQALQPDEVQLNVPTRPQARSRRLDARGNEIQPYDPNTKLPLKCLSPEIVRRFACEIETQTGIPTRYPTLQ